MFLVNITSFDNVLINMMRFVTFGGRNIEYNDAYLLLSTANKPIIQNEHISISKQAFFPWMSPSL